MAPVAVTVAASHPVFLYYRHGVIASEDCGEEIDTAVTIVGYGHDLDEHKHERRDYWLIKNSWGTSWGDNGYGRIAITEGTGICGINRQPSIVFIN
mmetsp:Transcript_47818/g.63207  ORF Transcript_47818/g.63207 Transcript_47818/m.63207 type:complete len:96 (+) Transcript_47818:728-1015(+)